MTEDEKRMFGMSKEDIREQYLESLTAKLSGLEMVVASILSDCQEELSGGVRFQLADRESARDERLRKQLNVAKFILFEMMESKREKEIA